MAAPVIPVLGYGTYPLKGAEARSATEMAIEVGYRHIDTAQWYFNEEEVGAAVRESGPLREKLFVVTKVHPGNLARERFRPSVDESLEKLGLPRVDLLLIHWPPRDPALFEPALEELARAQDDGLTKLIGVSNFAPGQIGRAARFLGRPLACNQVEFHPYLDQSRLMAASLAAGVPLSAYSSVARGKVLSDPVITGIAGRLGRTPAAVVLRWIIQQDVIALCQTSKRENAVSNLEALSFALSDEDMAAISALRSRNLRVVDLRDIAPDWERD